MIRKFETEGTVDSRLSGESGQWSSKSIKGRRANQFDNPENDGFYSRREWSQHFIEVSNAM